MNPNPTSWLSNNIKSICALIIVIGVIGYLYMITLISTDTTVRSQALIAMITLGTGVTAYYFGYSQGASKKDEAQAQLTANSQVQTTTTTSGPITPPTDQPPV
jgi:hypothetical protein